MSQTTTTTTLPQVTIKRNPGTAGNASTGMNTTVELDGTPLRGVTFLKFELKPNRVGKLTLELICDFNVEDLPVELIQK